MSSSLCIDSRGRCTGASEADSTFLEIHAAQKKDNIPLIYHSPRNSRLPVRTQSHRNHKARKSISEAK